MRLLIAGILCATFALGSTNAYAQTQRERAEGLEAAEKLGRWLWSVRNEFQTLEEQSERLSDLRERIVDARENPAALTGENYAKLLIDLTMLIPREARLPSSVKTAVNILVRPIALIIEKSINFSLTLARRNFNNQMKLLAGDTSMTESEKAWKAAKSAGSTRQVQLKLLLDWSLEKARITR